MRPRELSYVCPICGWQGMLEPTEPARDALCPECNTLMYPRPWSDTWGVALLWIGIVLVAVAMAARSL